MQAYGNLCSLFYDATKGFAPQREVDFYAQFIDAQPLLRQGFQPSPMAMADTVVGRVLEAMSGSGRLQIPLIERGYVVDGVDNAPAMIARCHERSAVRGVIAPVYEQSLEQLSLPHCYQTVIIAVGSFQLIANRAVAQAVLQKLRAHMHIGGSLLIDLFTPNVHDTEPSIRIARLDKERVIRLTTRYIYDIPRRVADAYCAYELLVHGAVQQREDELIQVTWYTDDELNDILAAAGFEVVRYYDENLRPSGPSHIVHARAV